MSEIRNQKSEVKNPQSGRPLGHRNPQSDHPLLARLRQNSPIICDGAMGTMLYSLGVPANHCFDECNLSQVRLSVGQR